MQHRAKQTVIVVTCGMLLGHPAAASDAEFARALNEARCMPARISVLRDAKDVKSYEVTCLGSPPTNIGVFCTKRACSASPATGDTASNPTSNDQR